MRDGTDPDLFGRDDTAVTAAAVRDDRLRWLICVAAGTTRALPHEYRQARDVLAELAIDHPTAAKALRLAVLLAELGVVRP